MKSYAYLRPKTHRIYVQVTSVIDATGFMFPRTILWDDGRIFQIDKVTDYRPASSPIGHIDGDCYTVMIRGQERFLFFERANPRSAARIGRWFVESAFPKE